MDQHPRGGRKMVGKGEQAWGRWEPEGNVPGKEMGPSERGRRGGGRWRNQSARRREQRQRVEDDEEAIWHRWSPTSRLRLVSFFSGEIFGRCVLERGREEARGAPQTFSSCFPSPTATNDELDRTQRNTVVETRNGGRRLSPVLVGLGQRSGAASL